MKFGVCTDLQNAGLFAKAGYNYIELNVSRDLKPEEPETVFAEDLKKIKSAPLPAKAANCFIPGDLKIVGPDVDDERLEHYVIEAFERAQRAGISVIVFGSGGARKIPDGFPTKKGYKQLVDFGGLVGTLAKKSKMTIVAEPLNTAETNQLNTVAQAAQYVKDVGHPSMKLLVDAFHWARENEPAADIVAFAPLLAHTHIATYTSRCAPGLEDCDFGEFFKALRDGGYNGTLSIEGSWSDLPSQARRSLEVLESAYSL